MLSKFRADDCTWALCRRAATEEHDSTSCVLETRLQQTDSHTQCNPGTSQRSLIADYWPRILLQGFQHIGKLEFGLLNRQQETRLRSHRWRCTAWQGLLHAGSHSTRDDAQHFLNLFRVVLLCRVSEPNFTEAKDLLPTLLPRNT